MSAGEAAAPVTPYAEIAGIGFLCRDLARAREWVGEALGPLAIDDDRHRGLRDTLAAFLDTGGSYTATAQRLGCHKNTVQYRVRRAEAQLGHAARDRRLDLELALLACCWLGPTVLHPAHK